MGSAAPRTWSTSLRCAKQLEHCTSKHHASQRAAGMPAALFVCLMHVAFSHINALSPRRSPTPTSRVTLLRLSHAPRPRSSLPCPPRHAPVAALPRPISPCLVPGMQFEARVGSFLPTFQVDNCFRELFPAVLLPPKTGLLTDPEKPSDSSLELFRPVSPGKREPPIIRQNQAATNP